MRHKLFIYLAVIPWLVPQFTLETPTVTAVETPWLAQ